MSMDYKNEFGVNNKILIKNSMTTHNRKYTFDINKKSIIRQNYKK